LAFPGTRWYVLTVQDPQMYAIRKSLGTTDLMVWAQSQVKWAKVT